MVERARELWRKAQRSRPWRTYSHFTDVGGVVLSGGMSYQALFAVFAALWVGFGIFGITLRGRPELLETLVMQINTFVPGLLGDSDDSGAVELQTLLETHALDLTSIIAGGSLIWVALNWFTGTRRSIRLIFGLEVKQYRNAALLKLRDLVLAFGFFVAIVVSASLTVVSSTLMASIYDWLGVDPDSWLFTWLGTAVRYAAMYVFDVLVLLAMHRFLAEIRLPWRTMLAGCMLGGAGLMGLKVLGGVLLTGTSRNPLLATFAVVVGLLIWFNILCRLLLLASSWIATGVDRTLGLPPDEVSARSL